MAVIKVPKPPKSAFNKNRPASNLLQAQIEHLEAAAGVHAAGPVAFAARPGALAAQAAKVPRPRTEGEAAAYIAQLTQMVREPASGDAMPAFAMAAAPAPPRRRRVAPTKARGPRKRTTASRKPASKKKVRRSPERATARRKHR